MDASTHSPSTIATATADARQQHRGILMPLVRGLRRLRGDRSGAGAVEFAILAPILLMLYISAFEITVGMSIAKRTSRAAGTIADLVTQQPAMTKATLSTMVGVAQSIYAPYTPQNMKLKVSAIKVDATKVARIYWSWQQDNTRPYVPNAVVTLPADLNNANSFLIRAELQLDHQLGMFLSNTMSYDTRTVTIKREFYFRQRVGEEVPCNEC